MKVKFTKSHVARNHQTNQFVEHSPEDEIEIDEKRAKILIEKEIAEPVKKKLAARKQPGK